MKAHVTRAEGRCCIGCDQAFNSTRKVADWQTVRESQRTDGEKAITTGPVCIDCAPVRRGAAVVPDEASSHHGHRVELAEGVAVEFMAPAMSPGCEPALLCEWRPAIPAITPAMREQYREARDSFIQQVRAASGLTSARIVEPDIGHPAV